MNEKFTNEDIINAAYRCIGHKIECENCKLATSEESCVERFARYIVNNTKNELAPAATGTSSEVSTRDTTNLTHLDDSTLLDICQEKLEEISQIALDDYPNEFLTGYACAVRDNIKRLRGAN